jgi:hypothetical protein
MTILAISGICLLNSSYTIALSNFFLFFCKDFFFSSLGMNPTPLHFLQVYSFLLTPVTLHLLQGFNSSVYWNSNLSAADVLVSIGKGFLGI